jgi:ubiquitin carboxyl-terminal hydrolase 4/11
VYDLYAVANHMGSSSGGHYTAYCQNFCDKHWYEFNDERVSRISRSDITEPSLASYVLLYRMVSTATTATAGVMISSL